MVKASTETSRCRDGKYAETEALGDRRALVGVLLAPD
jgi:hypothetical protein